jgi:hypothetical protein
MWFTGRNHLKGDTSCVVCAFRSSESACTPLGWVTITDKRVSDPVYRTREAAEQDAELLRARGIETRVAGVYLAPPSATQRREGAVEGMSLLLGTYEDHPDISLGARVAKALEEFDAIHAPVGPGATNG